MDDTNTEIGVRKTFIQLLAPKKKKKAQAVQIEKLFEPIKI